MIVVGTWNDVVDVGYYLEKYDLPIKDQRWTYSIHYEAWTLRNVDEHYDTLVALRFCQDPSIRIVE